MSSPSAHLLVYLETHPESGLFLPSPLSLPPASPSVAAAIGHQPPSAAISHHRPVARVVNWALTATVPASAPGTTTAVLARRREPGSPWGVGAPGRPAPGLAEELPPTLRRWRPPSSSPGPRVAWTPHPLPERAGDTRQGCTNCPRTSDQGVVPPALRRFPPRLRRGARLTPPPPRTGPCRPPFSPLAPALPRSPAPLPCPGWRTPGRVPAFGHLPPPLLKCNLLPEASRRPSHSSRRLPGHCSVFPAGRDPGTAGAAEGGAESPSGGPGAVGRERKGSRRLSLTL